MDLIKIGKFIATCRKERKLTQSELAEQLGISDRAISKWENGNCLPDAGKMLDLCGVLKISAGELLSGEKIEMKDTLSQELDFFFENVMDTVVSYFKEEVAV